MEQHAQPAAPTEASSGPIEVKPPESVPAPAGAAPAAPRDPNAPKPRQFPIRPPIGDKPGFIWVANEDGVGGLGRIYLVKMRFGREIERIRMTKHYKKFSAKHVRDEVDHLIGDLLYHEREHGALTENTVRDVIAKVAKRLSGPPRRPGPGRGGPPRGPGGPRPGGRDQGPPRDQRAAPAPEGQPNSPDGPRPAQKYTANPPRPGDAPRGPLGPHSNRPHRGAPGRSTPGPRPSPNQPPPYEP